MLCSFLRSGDWTGLDIGKYQAFMSYQRIDRDTVPEGLYVYDIRHTDSGSMGKGTIEEYVLVNFEATIVTAVPFKFPKGRSYYTISNYSYTGETEDASKLEQWFLNNKDRKPLTSKK